MSESTEHDVSLESQSVSPASMPVPQLGSDGAKFPLGSLVVFGVLGLLIWNCGGTFGIPFGPAYKSPAERESIRQSNDALDAKLTEDYKKRNDPSTYLSVGKFEWFKDESGLIFIRASAKNISTKRLSFARVEYKLTNKKNEITGSATDTASNIGPGETWAISALVPDPTEANYAELSELKVSPSE